MNFWHIWNVITGFVCDSLGGNPRETGLSEIVDREVQGKYQPVQYHWVESHTPVYQ